MGFTYREVKDLYDNLASSGATTASLPEWSTEMNRLSGTDLYSSGQNDNIIKRASVGIDRLLEATGLPDLGGAIGGAVGGLIGQEDLGRNIGQGLPRGVVDFAPLLLSGPLGMGAALAGTAALSGANTYTSTGSPAAGLLAAATNVAMPGISNLVEQQVLKRIGGRVLSGVAGDEAFLSSLGQKGGVTAVEQYVPQTTGQAVKSIGAGTAAGAALGELSSAGQAGLIPDDPNDPNSTYNFSPTAMLLNLTLGQAPFSAINAVKHGAVGWGGEATKAHADALQRTMDKTEQVMQIRKAEDDLRNKSPIETIPVITPQTVNLEELRVAKAAAEKEATPESIVIAKDLGEKEEAALEATKNSPTTVLGETVSPVSNRVELTGEVHYDRPSTGYRIIRVGDTPENRAAGYEPGDLIGYSTKFEPKTEPGKFSIPKRFSSKIVDNRKGSDPGAELPVQPTAAEPFDHVPMFEEIHRKLSAATTNEELRSAVEDANGVLAMKGFSPISDKLLSSHQERFQVGRKEAVTAVVGNTKRQLDAVLAKEKESYTREQEVSAAQQHLAPILEQSKLEGADPEVVKRAGIYERAQAHLLKRGENGQAIVNSGELDRMFHKADQAGAFKSDLGEQVFFEKLFNMAEKGKGITQEMRKANTVEEKVDNSIEAAPIKHTLVEQAAKATVDDSARQAYDGWAGKDSTTYEADAATFRTLTDEFGSLHDLKPEEAAEFLAENEGGEHTPATSDEVKEFLTRPHVVAMNDVYQNEVAKLRNHAPIPLTPVDRWRNIPGHLQDHLKPLAESAEKSGLANQIEDLAAQKLSSKQIATQLNTTDETVNAVRLGRGIPSWTESRELNQGGASAEVSPEFTTWLENRNKISAPAKPFVPTSDVDLGTMDSIGKTGLDAVNFLKNSNEPVAMALGHSLSQFPHLLQRAAINWVEDSISYATLHSDGKVSINLSHGLLSADPEYRKYAVAHETVHALSMAALREEHNSQHVQGLEDLRSQLIARLPEDTRTLLENAQKSGWMEQHTVGAANYSELGGTEKQRDLVYSLMNVDEFVAQGFTSPHLRQFMQQTKLGNQTGFGRFTSWIKQLVGMGEKVHDNAFEEFMSKSSKLIDRGEYVAEAQNYSDRWFQNKGYSPEDSAIQTQRVLGAVMSGTDKKGLFDALTQPGRRIAAVEARQRIFDRMPDADKLATEDVISELGYKIENMNTFVYDMLNGDVADVREALELMPLRSSKLVLENIKDVHDVLEAVRGMSDSKNEGLVNLADSKSLRFATDEALKATREALKLQDAEAEASGFILNLNSLAPDAFADYAPQVIAQSNLPGSFPLAQILDPTKDAVKNVGGWIEDFLKQPAMIARSNPVLAEAMDRGYQLQSNARQYLSETLKVFGMDLNTGKFSSEAAKRSAKVVSHKKSENAINQWMYLNNEIARKEERGVTLLSENHPEVMKLKAGLTDEQWSGVRDTMVQQVASTMKNYEQALGMMQKVASTRGAVIAMHDAGVKVEQGVTLAGTLFEAIVQSKADPMGAQAKVQSVQQRMTPEGFLELYKFTQGEAEKYSAYKEHFDANPAWASAQRQEKYLVKFFVNGKPQQLQASSVKEANELFRLHKGTGKPVIEPNYKGDQDAFPTLGPDAPGLMQRLKEVEENQFSMMAKKYPPEVIEDMKRTSAIMQFGREVGANVGGIPSSVIPPRLLSQGADKLPWLWNHISWAERQSNYWTRQLFRAQIDAELSNPEIAANDDYVRTIKTHRDNMLQRDPELARKIQKFTTSWFMGFAPASAMVNATQSMTTHVAELTSMTGKPIESYKKVLSAFGKLTNHWKTGKWADPELDWVMKRAALDGEIDYSMFDDNAAAQDAAIIGHKRQMLKNKPQTLGQRIGTLAGAYANASMFLFKGVERFNNQAAIIAGFEHYKSQGLSREEAYVEAKRFNHSVNYGGGKANRPIGAFSGRGDTLRSAAMFGTSMQTYVIGTTTQICRYLKQGFFQPAGVTPAEKWNGRKAAVQMLGTQLAAAGALGMPFVAGALGVINQFFPDLEINKNIREFASQFFGEDEEDGHVISDAAMTGLPSMLGWDFQSRLSMGSIPGVDANNGFQPGLLLGAPANLIGNFFHGVGKLANGEPQGATAFLPPAIKKLSSLVMSGGQIEDYKGRPLLTPTPGESVGIALGFQPKRQSDLTAASRMLDQTEEVAARREGRFRESLADETLKGNFGTVRQTLLARAQSEPDFDPVEGVRAVARAAEEKTFPRDLRSEGSARTSGERQQLLSALKVNPQNTAEVERVRFRDQIMQRLGAPLTRKQDVEMAVVMDQLRTKSPGATRSELRREATRLLRNSSRASGTLSPELQ